MTFKHKLARRLALLRNALVLAAVFTTACELPLGTRLPGDPPAVASVVVAPASGAVSVGATLRLTATLQDAAGRPLSGRAIAWTSDAPGRATVDAGGAVTGVSAGAATITATSDGTRGIGSVTVSTIPVASVTVAPASASIPRGGAVQLAATPRDASGNPLSGRPVTWTSGSTAVATVNATGLATGVAVGSATFTATSEGKSGTAIVTVTAVPVASVTVTPAAASIVVGGTVLLSATPKDANGNPLTGRTVTWSSGSTAVATVSSSGLVTGAAGGSATISASSEGKTGTSVTTVTAGGGSGVVTDPSTVFSEPVTAKPGYLAPIVPQPFGTAITRIAGDNGTSFTFSAGGSGTWGTDVRHHYQKDQPWSADGSLLALQNSGSPSVVYLDGDTYQPIRGKCSNYSPGDDRWHPSAAHPHERISVSGSQLSWFDVVTCTRTRTWALPFSADGFGSGEGNPSFDGRFAALSNGTQMVVVDMEANIIGPVVDVTDCGMSGCSIDWVSISPSGKYAVVSYNGDYPRVYDVHPVTLALTPRPMPQIYAGCHGTAARGFVYDLGHADMTLNPFDSNEDVLIGQEHCGNRGKTVAGVLIGGVMMTRLKDGAITALTNPANEAYPHHISARAYNRPGWVYVGYYNSAGQRFNDEIVAVRLDGSQAVERLAHKHSAFSGCYRCEAHAVPSPDGLRVLWASNWALNGDGTSSVIQAYVLDRRLLR